MQKTEKQSKWAILSITGTIVRSGNLKYIKPQSVEVIGEIENPKVEVKSEGTFLSTGNYQTKPIEDPTTREKLEKDLDSLFGVKEVVFKKDSLCLCNYSQNNSYRFQTDEQTGDSKKGKVEIAVEY